MRDLRLWWSVLLRRALTDGFLRISPGSGSASTIGEDSYDFLHVFFETDFQNSIGFVDNQRLQISEDKSLGILDIRKEFDELIP